MFDGVSVAFLEYLIECGRWFELKWITFIGIEREEKKWKNVLVDEDREKERNRFLTRRSREKKQVHRWAVGWAAAFIIPIMVEWLDGTRSLVTFQFDSFHSLAQHVSIRRRCTGDRAHVNYISIIFVFIIVRSHQKPNEVVIDVDGQHFSCIEFIHV